MFQLRGVWEGCGMFAFFFFLSIVFFLYKIVVFSCVFRLAFCILSPCFCHFLSFVLFDIFFLTRCWMCALLLGAAFWVH